MTTRAILKARIADDLTRSDITTQIEEAISEAITHYASERFYFNESRTSTFVTVIGQREYTPADTIVRVDRIYITVDGDVRELWRLDDFDMELLHDSNVLTGVPARWSYYNQAFSLYPAPEAVYTVRILGQVRKAGPANDAETGNVWMTEAFEAIRCRAKMYICAHISMDTEMLQVLAAAEDAAVNRLRSETARRIGTGRITPTNW